MARLRHRVSGVVVNVRDDRVMGSAWESADKAARATAESSDAPKKAPAKKASKKK